MRIISIFVSVFLFADLSEPLIFRKVAEFPMGAMATKPFGFDTDHDGNQNLILSPVFSYFPIYLYEHIGYDRYVLEDTITWSYLWDVGYLDTDSLINMVGTVDGWPYRLYVYESPTYNSNPINIVWQDSGFMNICGGYITDIDQDGLKEILFGYYNGGPHACVYENTGDNQYSLVWQDTINPFYGGVTGDFDMDGRMEFITSLGGSFGEVYIWECLGNNDYQGIFYDSLPKPNNIDVFKAHDMDGNGKPEFLCTCTDFFRGRAWLYLYETIGDNNYNFIFIDSVIGLPIGMNMSYSVCGDIDSDGKEEIVWSAFNQWHIYKATGVHQYQKIFSSAWTQHDENIMNVYDLNENGYPEVIESWDEGGIPSIEGTTIWEIEGVRLHKPNGGETLHPNQQYAITWQKFDPPGADSFALFVSYDNGVNYQTITTIQQSNDTMFLWTVPNVISDSCKTMVWAYGPPRPGEQQPRGTAWDFGDFKIRPGSDVAETQYRPAYYNLRI